jgi:hybrid cluster-associated redox disulfide protein
LQKAKKGIIITPSKIRRIRIMARVNKSTMIGELLQIDENVAPILLNIGMHCLGCPSSQMETIEQAAMVHGIDPDMLVDEINNFLEAQG